MVTVGIALFLLGGLVTILQNVRKANFNQQALAQLQDQQRFAMTVLGDMIQQAGYYPSAIGQTQSSALGAGGPWQAGQAFFGTHTGAPGVPDTITVRFMTAGAPNDQMIRCDGSINNGPGEVETNQFTVVPPAGNVPGQLFCQLNNNAPVALVNGIQDMQIYYGVNRNAPLLNYNVDTYLTAQHMNKPQGDWINISSVRVVLTFTNPLYDPSAPVTPGNQPTIVFERVVSVMARAGVHS
jgi:type IV pilus assembly protein PilW